MGPSGSGKDSLMSGLLAAYPDAGLVAARRYITRPESAGGEAHVSVTPERFAELSENGAFCMQWQSHGLFYGVPAAIRDDLSAGRIVSSTVPAATFPRRNRPSPSLSRSSWTCRSPCSRNASFPGDGRRVST